MMVYFCPGSGVALPSSEAFALSIVFLKRLNLESQYYIENTAHSERPNRKPLQSNGSRGQDNIRLRIPKARSKIPPANSQPQPGILKLLRSKERP
jgi:hypothetical protein